MKRFVASTARRCILLALFWVVMSINGKAQTMPAVVTTLGNWGFGAGGTYNGYYDTFRYSQKSIAIGPDGFARIAEANSQGIVMIRCTDAPCSSPVVRLVAAVNTSPYYGVQIAIGSDGFPIFAYDLMAGSPFNSDGGQYITYVKCNDIDCISNYNIPLADASNESQFSITGGPNGVDYVAFEGGRDQCQPTSEPQNISLATITRGSPSVQVIAPNISCTANLSASVVAGSDGNAAVTWISDTTSDAQASSRCNPGGYYNPGCLYYYANGVTTQIAADEGGFQAHDMVIGNDGFARIVYYTATNPSALAVVQCLNLNCTQFSRGPNILPINSQYGWDSEEEEAIALGSDGFPRLVGGAGTNPDGVPKQIEFVTCSTANCSSSTISLVATNAGVVPSIGSVSMVANGDGTYSAVTADYGPGCTFGATSCSSGGNVNYLLIGSGADLVDPVPDPVTCPGACLMSGPAVMSTQQLQTNGSKGRKVKGVAADGVTEVVVRVATANVGDRVTFTLMNDQQTQPPTQSTNANEDGALGQPGATSFSQSTVTVNAIGVTSGGQTFPYAFAVYRAPVDFARSTGGGYKLGTCGSKANTSDDQLQCRSVSIQVTSNGATNSTPVTIVRPPVIMIHGLWGDWQAWDNFGPLIKGNNADPRFTVDRLNYNNPLIAPIATTTPPYPSNLFNKHPISANSLGFDYNAPKLLQQLRKYITSYKTANPVGRPIAVVQADVVAHSMGGDITRYMVLSQSPKFLLNNNFQQGDIHKLITIGTPHLGTPVATRFLDPSEDGKCLQNVFAGRGFYAFDTVTLIGIGTVQGAVNDLKDDGTSAALNSIATQSQHPLPTAFIAGEYTNWAALNTGTAYGLWLYCGQISRDPLALSITSSGWQAIFNNQVNDALVSQTSALNGMTYNGYLSINSVHGQGIEKIGFSPPSLLDQAVPAPGVPDTVINLLNTPLTQSPYFYINP